MPYKDDIAQTVHHIASDLFHANLLSQEKLQVFDQLCLTPVEPLDGAAIRAIRKKEALTQAAFAVHLNISKNQVSDWERGVKKPSGAALKLLNIIKHKGIEAIVY